MAAVFPSEEWLKELEENLNTDPKYHAVAKNWEGDILFFIEPEGNLKERMTFYLDLWHGTCRKVIFKPSPESFPNPTFTLTASYKDITSVGKPGSSWKSIAIGVGVGIGAAFFIIAASYGTG